MNIFLKFFPLILAIGMAFLNNSNLKKLNFQIQFPMIRVLFRAFCFAILPVNSSVDRGKSNKWVTFQPQVSSNLT